MPYRASPEAAAHLHPVEHSACEGLWLTLACLQPAQGHGSEQTCSVHCIIPPPSIKCNLKKPYQLSLIVNDFSRGTQRVVDSYQHWADVGQCGGLTVNRSQYPVETVVTIKTS